MTTWDKIKKEVYIDWELIWGWKGRLFVILSLSFWIPYRYAPKGSPVDADIQERRMLQAIFGRNEGEFQITIPFLRLTFVWGRESYNEILGGWKDANAAMYKDR